MKYLTLICIFLLIVACKGNTPNIPQNTLNAAEDTSYVDNKGDKYKFLGQIPEELRTPAQNTLIDKLNEVTVNYISVKNNHMIFDLTKDEFIAKGLPARFYNSLQKNIRDNNDFFDTNGIKDVDKMIEKRKKEYILLHPDTH